MTPDLEQPAKRDADLILIGAGLTSALIAARLSCLRPAPSITILEQSAVPFGNHTWSFHATDLADSAGPWIDPLVAHRWPRQTVRFPRYSRTLDTGYASLTSESVERRLGDLQNVRMETGTSVVRATARHVELADGSTRTADCIIDARGFASDPALRIGFQKFLGLEVETAAPHGLENPIIMDATVPQLDGYRFLYCLPLSPHRLLLEDTRYADEADLDLVAVERAIFGYAAEQGWRISDVVRREQGALPISLAFEAEDFWRRQPKDVPIVGMRACLFHPTTGYSVPEAAAVADLIAGCWPILSEPLANRIRTHALERARRQSFYRLLNRMLFHAAVPEKRHLVLQRFYRLPEKLIQHFYAGRTSQAEMMRILIGKPPVPLARALACASETTFLKRAER